MGCGMGGRVGGTMEQVQNGQKGGMGGGNRQQEGGWWKPGVKQIGVWEGGGSGTYLVSLRDGWVGVKQVWVVEQV
jgi:hypothetical protein